MAADDQPHLQPFIPNQVQNAESKFHLFPQLPKELRDKIWCYVMQRPRFIHLRLSDPDFRAAPTTDAAEMSQLTNNNERFWAITDGQQAMSKLFRVNNESREAALSFYRVRFPCWLRTRIVEGEILKPRILYFNPENDFLRITPEWSVKNTLFNFLYLLKTTYDPLHIGLRNLMVDDIDIAGNDLYLMEPSSSNLDAGSKEAFTNILRNLHQVFFYSTIRAGRQILGTHTGVPTPGVTIYNRSFPIEAKVPIFDRLAHDPRAIGEDLKEVFIGMHDNRSTIYLWNQILEKWGISASSLDIEYKWHIAFDPPRGMELRILSRLCFRASGSRATSSQ
ncbi:hypothetical protein G7Y89_g15541 [Cudoniella acicularis]|uniref:2EXR domain-containing protein n=1 Tax=Cudoniella acicularis TaxID=354080 RepID=A0A8H4QL66_9HELO|nr:hypothetical protein G7Y89_g15541 [Cudoniella acicularis]